MACFVQSRKAGRVIVLTTHFMDEADILGDRIAVIAHGSLRVVGSSVFLKNRFGVGYTLSVSGRRHGAGGSGSGGDVGDAANGASALDVRSVDGIVASFVASAVAADGEGAATDSDASGGGLRERLYVLPLGAVADFAPLLDVIEAKKANLGVVHVGVSSCTLEEAYLRLTAALDVIASAAEEASMEGRPFDARAAFAVMDLSTMGTLHDAVASGANAAAAAGIEAVLVATPELPAETLAAAVAGSPSFLAQARAQFVRRAAQAWRDRRFVYLQCVKPIQFVAIGLIFRAAARVDVANPALPVLFNGASLCLGGAWQLGVSGIGGVRAHMAAAVARTCAIPASINVTSGDGVSAVLLSSAGAGYAGAVLTSASGAVTLLYNTSLLNGLPALLDVMQNASMAAAGGGGGLLTSYAPLPLSDLSPVVGRFVTAALVGYYIAFGFCTVTALQAMVVVGERVRRTKMMQRVMGCDMRAYWAGTWAWDALLCCVPVAGTIVVVLSTVPSLQSSAGIGAAFALLLAFALSSPGAGYIVSFRLRSESAALMATLFSLYAATTLVFWASFGAEYPVDGTGAGGGAGGAGAAGAGGIVIRYIGMLIVPQYSLAKGFADAAAAGYCPALVDVPGGAGASGVGAACALGAPFSWHVTGQKLCFLLLLLPAYYWAVVSMEARSAREMRLAPGASVAGAAPPGAEDADVEAERAAVDAAAAAVPPPPGIVLSHLRKVYASSLGAPPKVAVADLSLLVPPGEVLGIVGPNGAGKTSFLAMVTGEVAPTCGYALLGGVRAGAGGGAERGLGCVAAARAARLRRRALHARGGGPAPRRMCLTGCAQLLSAVRRAL